MKYYIILLFLTVSLTSFAQKVEKDGKTYEVKKEKVFLDGKDVTETLNLEEKDAILKQVATILGKIKMQEKVQKASEKLEKDKKKAEKARKKYEKLKKKGKLSPEDESKWLEKLEKFTKRLEKAKRKL
ncbi:hypothetical protein [Winogradskyella sp.]|uniref:hypothetical protein n=1 Tax=Winogradskyella sp. TaxID=1883156 RepID=UPI0025EEF209|nr:hypothetical protein [Winogradskyella sp.]